MKDLARVVSLCDDVLLSLVSLLCVVVVVVVVVVVRVWLVVCWQGLFIAASFACSLEFVGVVGSSIGGLVPSLVRLFVVRLLELMICTC